MKYHISVKFIAILLATVLLSISVCSAIGIIGLVGMGLYENTVEEKYEDQLVNNCHGLAVELAHRYASLKLGGMPDSYLEFYWSYDWVSQFRDGYYFYTIRDYDGNMLESTLTGSLPGAKTYGIEITNVNYRQVVDIRTISDNYYEFATEETCTDESFPNEISEEPVYTDVYYDYESESTKQISYRQAKLGKCTVEIFLLDGALEEEPYWDLLRLVYRFRYDLYWVLGVSLLLFAVCAVYLCCAAGRKSGAAEVRAEGLNRLPLDLYLFAAIAAESLLIMLGMETLDHLIRYTTYNGAVPIASLFILVASLVFVAFCYACAAQVKMPMGYWWRNCIIGRILRMFWRCGKWMIRGCRRFLGMLPAVWQLVVTALGMGFVLFVTYLLAFGNSFYRVNWFFVLILLGEIGLCAVVFCYAVYAFGVLKKGAEAMAREDLHRLVPTKYLIGPFRTFAWELNRLSGAARRAAEQQLKSERMKTELITNVSHDIKTPLTSIINYVDLLEKPHTQEEGQAYLEVLSRQSQRLKKLIDDLMDMSKASTGNVSVEIQKLDAAEAANQALGEFSDKLAQAGLVPVLRAPAEPVYVLADGRHTWRVLSNLLSNVVKYALPGTRVYIDLTLQEDKTLLSVKNISREALNVSADELTERFVRGDASRNTEGSGLGLNIAKSLMELQHGSLEVTVDGDLFKVTIAFPTARE